MCFCFALFSIRYVIHAENTDGYKQKCCAILPYKNIFFQKKSRKQRARNRNDEIIYADFADGIRFQKTAQNSNRNRRNQNEIEQNKNTDERDLPFSVITEKPRYDQKKSANQQIICSYGKASVDFRCFFIDDGTHNEKHTRNQNEAFSDEFESRKFSAGTACKRNTRKPNHTSRDFFEIQISVN